MLQYTGKQIKRVIMYQFIITVYFMILGISLYYKNPVLLVLVFVGGISMIAFVPVFRKIKKQNIKKQILKNPNLEVINVNKASWWEFEELPNFKKVNAKKAVWIREHNGRYVSKEDFIEKNNIKNEDEIMKLIFV